MGDKASHRLGEVLLVESWARVRAAKARSHFFAFVSCFVAAAPL